MDVTIIKYGIICPKCGSRSEVVAEEANPFLIECNGCERYIVIHGKRVYTVSKEYVYDIMMNHKLMICGHITDYQISRIAQNIASKNEIGELHDLLEEDMDVSDFIRKLK